MVRNIRNAKKRQIRNLITKRCNKIKEINLKSYSVSVDKKANKIKKNIYAIY